MYYCLVFSLCFSVISLSNRQKSGSHCLPLTYLLIHKPVSELIPLFHETPICQLEHCIYGHCLLFLLFYFSHCLSKESSCNAGDAGSIPGSERSPRRGNGNPFQYSCWENPMDSGTWWATVHGGHKESDRTKRLNTHTHSSPYLSEVLRYICITVRFLHHSLHNLHSCTLCPIKSYGCW